MQSRFIRYLSNGFHVKMWGKSNDTGAIGEEKVQHELKKQGHKIVVTNYRKPWGEIDIVSCADSVLHFVEVKAVDASNISRENLLSAPEERVDRRKQKRLRRIIQTFQSEYAGYEDCEFEIDIAAVYIDRNKDEVHIEFVKDIELSA